MRRLLFAVSLLCAMPALAQTQGRRAVLDHLLDTLRSAQSEADAAPVETRIEQVWLEQGTASVTLLVARGIRDLGNGASQEAFDDFDAAIALQPDMAEAWHRRAIARFQLGDSRGAVRDIEEALKLEPRFFPAFRTLASIAESRQDWKGAYAAWQKMMEIDPKTPGGVERLKDLKRRALGDVT